MGLPVRGRGAGVARRRRRAACGGCRRGYADVWRHDGMATPTRVIDLVTRTRETMRDVPLALHFHNTRGTGLANLYAALQLGVTHYDASVGGLGGCPYAPGATGNIATEEVVAMLEDMGIATGVDVEMLLDVAAA